MSATRRLKTELYLVVTSFGAEQILAKLHASPDCTVLAMAFYVRKIKKERECCVLGRQILST